MTLSSVHHRVRRAALHGALLALGLSASAPWACQRPRLSRGGDTSAPITLQVTNAPTQTVLRGLFQRAEKNHTLAPSVTGRITVDLQGVPFAEAPAQPKVMRVDHPFLCAIRDNATGTLLFLGTVSDPQ